MSKGQKLTSKGTLAKLFHIDGRELRVSVFDHLRLMKLLYFKTFDKYQH